MYYRCYFNLYNYLLGNDKFKIINRPIKLFCRFQTIIYLQKYIKCKLNWYFRNKY